MLIALPEEGRNRVLFRYNSMGQGLMREFRSLLGCEAFDINPGDDPPIDERDERITYAQQLTGMTPGSLKALIRQILQERGDGMAE